MTPLILPPAAQRDERAVQMLSAWIAENGLHCVMKVGSWHAQGIDEPQAWGKLLADVVQHLSEAIESETGSPKATTVAAISQAFHTELGDPTTRYKGGFAPGHS